MYKTNEVLLFVSFVLAEEERKQINCVMHNSCHGKKLKQDNGDVAFTKHKLCFHFKCFYKPSKIHKINFSSCDSSGIFYNDNRINSSGHGNPKCIYSYTIFASKNMKQKMLKLKDQIENSKIIARDFTSHYSIIDGESTKNQYEYT